MNLLRRIADAVSRGTPFTLRMTAGLVWLSNVSWKVPPGFGENADGCRGLCGFVQAGIDHPVAPGYPWILDHVVRPNLAVFGWGVLVMEFLLAGFLLAGAWARVAAVVGFGHSLTIALAVANAPDEWYWSYALMAVLHLAVFATADDRRRAGAGRGTVAALTAAYGLVVMVANVRNGFASSEFTRDWVLFGGSTDVPGDFGRNVFAGTVALGLAFVMVAVATWYTAGRPVARATGAALIAAAAIVVVAYGEDGNLLGARPSAAAVLVTVGLRLLARSDRPTPG
ncbi:MAG: hypothetical protein ACRD29_13410 [Acidimicrobiales bacterium]